MRTISIPSERSEADWNNPTVLNFGGTGLLSIVLSHEEFNEGLIGLNEGSGYGATVKGMFTLIQAPVSVPEPASLALLGAGLFGLGFARRCRAARA